MPVINTNVKALYTQNAMKVTERQSTEAMQQLSTGKRINSARDDAAGLAISQRMTQQIRSLNMAVKNAGDAISLIQTAEGATATITDMLQRMRELAVQAANTTNSNEQRGYLDQEFQQLKQQIQSIADQTEWNGFSILNGSAGERVGERPVYKVTSEGSFKGGVTHQIDSAKVNGTAVTSAVVTSGSLTKAGTLTLTVPTLAGSGATAVSGTLTLPDGRQETVAGSLNGAVITFTNTVLSEGTGVITVTAAASLAANDVVTMNLSRSLPSVETMLANDIIINGVTVPQGSPTFDKLSVGNSIGASAISRATAINQMTQDTGVAAVVNPNTMSGAAMSGSSVVSGTVTINGYTTPVVTTITNNLRENRRLMTEAINAISEQTGVRAINSDTDSRGISLVADDGRNIEVFFNTGETAANFSARTGLVQGVQIGTFSLESSVEGAIEVTSTGNWQNGGLRPGSYSDNTSVFTSKPREAVTTTANIQTLGDGDLVINGFAIRGAVPNDDTRSNTVAESSSRAGSAIAIAAAINERAADTGVRAVASPAFTEATAGPSVVTANAMRTVQLYINGTVVPITLDPTETTTQRRNNIIDTVNRQQGQHGVLASATADGRLHFETTDGRNLSIWYNNSVAGGGATAAELGLTGMQALGAAGLTAAPAAGTAIPTVYGTVRLESDKPITLTPGNNGFTAEGDFTTLGFQEGTFGGEVDNAVSKLTPPRTGRLNFHIGASGNQTIHIDLADYGSKGPITSEITGDVAETDPTKRINRINDVTAAQQMLAKLDTVMDRVNGNRAIMGAVMNRLDYVIDNLSNVATNTEASRSQIEDADYAKASTELAKTQIMQQAATAVLAQANTSLQNVLKLLQ